MDKDIFKLSNYIKRVNSVLDLKSYFVSNNFRFVEKYDEGYRDFVCCLIP